MPNTNSREQVYAEESFTSALSFTGTRTFLRLPEDLQGKRVLDICSGASEIVSELCHQGVQAYGLDYKYRNLKDLKRSVDYYYSKTAAEIQQGLSRLMGPQINTREYIVKGRQSRDRFFEDINRRRTRYVAGLAGELPFLDNTFDISFSIQGISKFLIDDPDIFLSALAEAIRVTKPGGQIQIHPWVANFGVELSAQTVNATHAYLRGLNIPHQTEQPRSPVPISPHLTIFKP